MVAIVLIANMVYRTCGKDYFDQFQHTNDAVVAAHEAVVLKVWQGQCARSISANARLARTLAITAVQDNFFQDTPMLKKCRSVLFFQNY